jgi:hypothetical protein
MNEEYFFVTDTLAVWRPFGILDIDKIYEFINFLNAYSEKNDPHFNRLIDLMHISGVSVRYEDLSSIASRRKTYLKEHLKHKVKFAFLVNNPLAYGMTRMYQMLSDDPHVETHLYESIEAVAEFLEVDASLIAP